MKAKLLLTCAISWHALAAQPLILGHYRNFDGCEIDLHADSTFYFSWHFDLMGSWTIGRWHLGHDTIILTAIPIYDTLTYRTENGGTADSLVLSQDTIPVRRSPDPPDWLHAGGQNWHPCLARLLFRKGRLYYLNDKGRTKVRWQRRWGERRGTKYPDWFVLQPPE